MTVDSLKTVFSLEDQYTAGANRATSATKNLSHAFGNGNAGSGLAGATAFALAELDSSTPVISEVVSVLKAAAIAATGVAVAVVGLGVHAMKTAGEMESLQLALKVYAGTTEETERQLRRLREVARLPGLGFREAIQGSVRLQAVGLNARLAERALMAFGNAIASSGGGKEELDGVILALGQIVSKGAVSAEEIGQIAERVPQIRKVLLEAFGTASSEAIQDLGITAEEFVFKVIAAFEKLPPAIVGAKNAFENVGDVADRILSQIGGSLNKALLPALNDVAGFFDFIESNNIFGQIVTGFLQLTDNTSAFSNSLRGALETLQKFPNVFGEIVEGPLGFLSQSKDFGDAIVRAAALAVSFVRVLPIGLEAVMTIIDEKMVAIRSFVNQVIDAVNGVIKVLREGFKWELTVDTPFGPKGIRSVVGGDRTLASLPKLGVSPEDLTLSPGQRRLKDAADEASKFSNALYDAYRAFKPSNEVANDADPGGFKSLSAQERTAKATEQIRDKFESIREQLFGGAARSAEATSARNLNRVTGQGMTGNPDFDRGIAYIARAFLDNQSAALVSTRRPIPRTR